MNNLDFVKEPLEVRSSVVESAAAKMLSTLLQEETIMQWPLVPGYIRARDRPTWRKLWSSWREFRSYTVTPCCTVSAFRLSLQRIVAIHKEAANEYSLNDQVSC